MTKYDTKMICLYDKDVIFGGLTDLTDEEKGQIRDEVYRQEMNAIFGMTSFNDEKMSYALEELYSKLKTSQFFRDIMLKSAASMMMTDDRFGLAIMYSYDFMSLTHKCVCEFLENNAVPDDLMNEYNKKLDNV